MKKQKKFYSSPGSFARNVKFGKDATSIHQFTGSIDTTAFISAIGMGNARNINVSVSVPTDYNSVLFGPITIGTNGALTINSGSAVIIKDIGEF